MLQRKKNNARARAKNELFEQMKMRTPEDIYGREAGQKIREQYADEYKQKLKNSVSFSLDRDKSKSG